MNIFCGIYTNHVCFIIHVYYNLYIIFSGMIEQLHLWMLIIYNCHRMTKALSEENTGARPASCAIWVLQCDRNAWAPFKMNRILLAVLWL